MTTAIIDYGSGNLHSARKAFERAARDGGVETDIIVTSDADQVARAERIVLPGVGAFRDCKQGLFAVPGLVEALSERVINKARPFLGICVGMQLMATAGLEFGTEQGLGWIPGEVRRIAPSDKSLKIPHMGWNTLTQTMPHHLLDNIATGADGLHAYFVHSYALFAERQEHLVAVADYAGAITAMVGRDNMVGTQFHPEKSQKLGLSLIANFLRWRP